jgi:hypothetical protein
MMGCLKPALFFRLLLQQLLEPWQMLCIPWIARKLRLTAIHHCRSSPSVRRKEVTFTGPFLADRDQLYLPAPATMLFRKRNRGEEEEIYRKGLTDPKSLGVLWPDRETRLDGERWLPRQIVRPPNGKDWTYESLAAAQIWIPASNFFEHMAATRMLGGLVKLVFPDVFSSEQRIGIGVNEATRTAKDGQLFAAQHRRPVLKREGNPVLAALLDDPADTGQSLGERVLTLGGRGRFAKVTAKPLSLEDFLPRTGKPWRQQSGRIYFRLTAITPLPVGSGPFGFPVDSAPLEFEQLRVHTAIMPAKPNTVGLWNRLDPQRVARAVYCHQPGTTWFVSADAPKSKDPANWQEAVMRQVLGARFVSLELASLGAMGFGALAAGEWPETVI